MAEEKLQISVGPPFYSKKIWEELQQAVRKHGELKGFFFDSDQQGDCVIRDFNN